MLRQRVITALILLAVLLPTLWVDASWPFALLSLLFISAAGWEWSRLNQAPGLRAWVLGAAVAGACLLMADRMGLPLWQSVQDLPGHGDGVAGHVHNWTHPLLGFYTAPAVWWAAAGVWVLGGAAALRWGGTHWLQVPAGARRTLGLLVLTAAWLALVESKAQGLNYLLSVMCLVWAADIGAYFGGRQFGRHKLAPSISPGKSWEGVVAGQLAVLLLATGWIWLDRHTGVDAPSFYSRLLQGLGPAGLVLVPAALAGMSVVGDLFESLIKRQAGEKDSSQLLPGHGGVLDRIDALLPVLPLSLGLLSFCHG
jgi:phosphatidate cytidylyltransferase